MHEAANLSERSHVSLSHGVCVVLTFCSPSLSCATFPTSPPTVFRVLFCALPLLTLDLRRIRDIQNRQHPLRSPPPAPLILACTRERGGGGGGGEVEGEGGERGKGRGREVGREGEGESSQ